MANPADVKEESTGAPIVQEVVTEKEMSKEQKQFTEELQGKLSLLEEKQKEDDKLNAGQSPDDEAARLAEEAA